MKNSTIIKEVDQLKFSKALANKVYNGFKIIERNDKLPFAVLLKEGKEVNHNLNFMIFCATFGLWTVPWLYINKASKSKKILLAIDEEGNVFEEKCYSK